MLTSLRGRLSKSLKQQSSELRGSTRGVSGASVANTFEIVANNFIYEARCRSYLNAYDMHKWVLRGAEYSRQARSHV